MLSCCAYYSCRRSVSNATTTIFFVLLAGCLNLYLNIYNVKLTCVAADNPSVCVADVTTVASSKIPIIPQDDDNNIEDASSTGNDNDKSKVAFVVFIGLEGTGHHFLQKLVNKSPFGHKIKEKGFAKLRSDISIALYSDNKKSSSIWALPCEKKPLGEYNPYENVVRLLKKFEANWMSASENEEVTIAVPLNLLGSRSAGMGSYPSFRGDCKPLQYPDVDLLYAACDEANVTCKHVVMVRDPHEVIRSTTNRKFGTPHFLIKLYTTMLDVMYAQVSSHRNRLLTLWDFNNETANGELGKLTMGYNNSTEFEIIYNSKRQAPYPPTDEEKNLLIPENLRPHFDVMTRSNERLKSLCRRIIQERK